MLNLGSEVRELKLGESFRSPTSSSSKSSSMAADAFHTIRYDFKPVSVDSSREATIEFGDGNQVTVTAPNSESSGHPESVFTGSRKPHLKECILIIDHETGEITIEKLSQQITVKQTRVELKGPSGSAPRPATPLSESGSLGNRKSHSPRASSQNHNHSGSSHRTSAAGGSSGGKSPISPPTPSSSLSSHSSQNNNNNRVAKSSPNLSSPAAITTSHSDDVSILSESSSDEDDDRRSHSAHANESVSKSPIHSTTFEKDGRPMSSSSSSSSSSGSSDDDDDENEDDEGQRSDPLSLNGSKANLPPTPSDVKMSSSDVDSDSDDDEDERRQRQEAKGEIKKRNGTANGKSSRNNDASAHNNSAPVLSMPQFNMLNDDLCLSESGSDDDDDE